MRRIILLTLFFIAFYNSYAQFSIGIKAGTNFSKVKFENENIQAVFNQYIQRRFDINEGVVSEFFFSKTLAIQSELIFTSKGYNYFQEVRDGKQKYYYVQLNTGGKIENKIDKKNYYFAMISPYLSYWLFGKRYENNKQIGIESEEKIEFSGEYNNDIYEFNRWDAGIILIFGIKHKFSSKRFGFIDLRYEFGLINNDKINVDGTYNRVFNVNFGYLFRL